MRRAGPGSLGAAGALAALAKRAFWPLALLALPGAFYVWSMHSAGTPIFMPTLWPHSYYNSRYGLAALPLLALGGAGLVAAAAALARRWWRCWWWRLDSAHWLVHPQAGSWITWEESRVNSEARRDWTGEAAAYLALALPCRAPVSSLRSAI